MTMGVSILESKVCVTYNESFQFQQKLRKKK